MLVVFVFVLGLRMHRVLAFLEVLVGSTPGLKLGLSPSRIVRPLLCASCMRMRSILLVMRGRARWVEKRVNEERSRVGGLNRKDN